MIDPAAIVQDPHVRSVRPFETLNGQGLSAHSSRTLSFKHFRNFTHADVGSSERSNDVDEHQSFAAVPFVGTNASRQ
jgi:hypothetical protein